MRLNLILFLLLIFSCYSCSILSQNNVKTDELLMLSIADTSLNPILDSVILLEKKCEYYDDSLLFTVNIRKIKNIFELQIESSNNINSALDYFEPVFGFFYYKNHLFIVYNAVYEKFFVKTDKSKRFKYFKNEKSNHSCDTLTFSNVIDDSFTIWNYWYVNNKFILKGRSSSCDQ